MNLYSVFKQLAFKLDPELIHDMAINSAHSLPALSLLFSPLKESPKYSISHNDLRWSFPVGLAAGFDKNARAIDFFKNMGFGAVEIGTITKKAQKGNEKPRIFRHPEIESLQNSMGFPNQGAAKIKENLLKLKNSDICIGANIGKNKDTTSEKTPAEYAYLYELFAPHCQYLVVNISSPNTPGLRDFQKKEMLTPILDALCEQKKKLDRPLLIKIAPDMEDKDVAMICELSKEYAFNGIVATNTTIKHSFGVGGLSGKYLKKISKGVRSKVCEVLREDPSQTIIGAGGIDSYQEIKEFWQEGGHFVQLYTALIYQGPTLLKQIANDIDLDLKKYKIRTVTELHQIIKENA